MALYLVAKSGPSQGESWEVSDGLTFGRKGTSIHLADSKVSSQHARIALNEEGRFEVIDLASKNGLILNGEKVRRVPLEPGCEFEIGQTHFQVLEMGSRPEETKAPAKQKKKWNEVLVAFFRRNLFEFENQPRELLPLRPALVLDFLKGPQAETRWVLGYGPRRAGRLSVDLPILEAQASETCFEIFPSPDGIIFKALGPEVRLNGRTVSSETLRIGDRIQIFDTELEVDFLE